MLDGASARDSRCLRQAMTWARVMVLNSAGWRSPVKAENSPDVILISPPGFGIGDVGEPFELGRHIDEVAELDRRERSPFDCNQVFRHHPPPRAPCFSPPCPAVFLT